MNRKVTLKNLSINLNGQQRNKKVICLLVSVFFLSGCAAYKFQRGKKPYEQGYVVSRDDYAILEYTIGKDNTVPGINLAEGRFNRRKKTVEDYYKKMGYIENRFKMAFWNPAVFFLGIVKGVFKLPFIAISDYRYEHNPEYRQKMIRLEEEKETRQKLRLKKLKEELNSYIQQDLAQENPLNTK